MKRHGSAAALGGRIGLGIGCSSSVSFDAPGAESELDDEFNAESDALWDRWFCIPFIGTDIRNNRRKPIAVGHHDPRTR